MAIDRNELADGVQQVLRKSAKSYGDALTEYGNTFLAYSKGEIGAARVAGAALKVATRESRRAVETSVDLCGACARWAASVVGVKFKRAESAAESGDGATESHK